MTDTHSNQILAAPHFVRGQLVEGNDVQHRSRDLGADFATPVLSLDQLVTPRSEMPPLLDVPLSEIIDFLVETGERLDLSTNVHLQECLERLSATNPLPRRVVENLYRNARHFLNKELLMSQVEVNFSNPEYLDRWITKTDMLGNVSSVRAFPSRMIHMLAGNSPAGCISSIAQGALVKAINLFKMPSSDPFTCVAILRTMAEVDPNHPVVKSMSAVYWRGGDESIEKTLYRPQYFDKIVAWGGGDAIKNVISYLGPGLQMVSFDPKSSISMIGAEAFTDDDSIAETAERTAADVSVYNQEACLASRFVFVEANQDNKAQIKKYCAKLLERLNVDREVSSAVAQPLPNDTRDEIEVLEAMGDYEVWGKGDGRGMVILTDKPVDFHPSNKTANIVMVPSLDEAIRYVNVATQTIGIWPPERKTDIRDRIASGGGQRVCQLGGANKHAMGGPHDAMYPLQRFVHWMADEDIA
ncbi:acyl-CoA reductase [Pseudomaricurvus sp.]|uniref:acyl-CoA reductase n=1 Tax=Pseudomaricurvus sp. TaxID=2004510 RepID=UPI003F6D0146